MSKKREEAIHEPRIPWSEFKDKFLHWCAARRLRRLEYEPEPLEEDILLDTTHR